jgi:hypothetical protein
MIGQKVDWPLRSFINHFKPESITRKIASAYCLDD